jgi:S1-C subfamily serine protease
VLPFVERVRHGSTAGKAGVRVDDLILSINGRSVSDVKEYDTQVSHLRPGEAIDLVVRRGRRIVSIHIETESAQ